MLQLLYGHNVHKFYKGILMTRLNKALGAFALASIFVLGTVWFKTIRVSTIHPTTDKQYASATVMITNPAKNSGGTGVIFHSSRANSTVLTNNHVCGLLEVGGYVITETRAYNVAYFQRSPSHDLCLVTVSANLHINTELADDEPELYDGAHISGHPALLPTIVTHGHFSQKQTIRVMLGFNPCTPEDEKGEDADLCFLLGGIPILKTFEAQVVSALIQPGSSGSAVWNDEGKIAGLVFAGAGDLGYAMVVPYEYILNFIYNEVPTAAIQKPGQIVQNTVNHKDARMKLKAACLDRSNKVKIKSEYCKAVLKDTLF